MFFDPPKELHHCGWSSDTITVTEQLDTDMNYLE